MNPAALRYAASFLDRFNLLGYSGRGFVALALAGAHPDRPAKLALVQSPLFPAP